MISGIVLAAGLSSRMGGRSKALLPLGDSGTFVTRAVRSLIHGGLSDIVVVVGHQREDVERSLHASGLPVRTAFNPVFRSGQLSSVLAGLDAVARGAADRGAADRGEVEGVVLALVDAPLFSVETVTAIVRRFLDTRAPVVRPVRGSAHGHPVLVSRQLFDAIRRADLSTGAKPIIRQHVSAAGDVEVDDDGAFVDVDTPEEYASVIASLGAGDGASARVG
ncbi:MAG: NTP transferase domain-containing protein [Vicinamibacterales bacterium]